MKKIISLFMALVMALSLAACSTNQSPSESTPEESSLPTNESTPAPSNTNGKNLVVYFSMPETTDPDNMTEEEANSTVIIDGEVLGNTQYMAYVIQETVGADIFRIEPETPYPTDHDTLVDLAKEEQNDNARPSIKDTIENFDTYENIFVGYPNWWGDMPMILYSFFDEYDFSGKTIIPFNTHGGSGFSDTISTIKELEPNAEVLDGKSISRNDIQDAEQEIVDWVNSLGLTESEEEPDSSAEVQNPTNEAGKTLVVYYSATGNTENVANYIAAATNGDLFELEPVEPYSDADLNWTDITAVLCVNMTTNLCGTLNWWLILWKTGTAMIPFSSAIPFGGALPLGPLTALLKQTILPVRQSFLSALLPVRDLAKAASCLRKWRAQAIGRRASVSVPALPKRM